jgi:hypothetical protein
VIPTPAQTLLLLVAIVVAFLTGLAIGALNDPSEVAPTVEYVEVLSGDFDDVPLIMETTMGNTFRWTCDMHFTPAPNDEHSAECEQEEP